MLFKKTNVKIEAQEIKSVHVMEQAEVLCRLRTLEEKVANIEQVINDKDR